VIPIAQLLAPVTATQFRAQMVASLVTLGIPANQWAAGGVFSSILTIVSIILGMLSSSLSTVINGFFLPTATGNGLTLLAYYVYGVTAPTATFASGSITFTNASGASYSKAAGAVILTNPLNGQTYATTQALTLGPVSSQTITVQATTVGTVGNAAPGTVTGIVSPSMPGVTVTNAAAILGLDAPSDATVRQLCLNSLGARSVRGPRTAYAYAVQTATNSVTGSPVNINRWQISNNHQGTVTVVVASPTGAPTATDIAGVVASIEANARPQGIAVVVTAASVANDTDTLTVWCSVPTPVTAAQVQTAVEAALETLYTSFAIGGVTASDDTHASFTGLLADAKVGAIAAGVQSLGGTLLSVQGANDLALVSTQVAVDALAAPVIRLIAPAGLS
jgi:hypothetical protein